VVGVIDPGTADDRFLSLPVVRDFAAAAERCDGVLLTDLKHPADTLAQILGQFGPERVFVPALLAGRAHRPPSHAKAAEPRT
jgi:hypothetical protein